MRLHGSPIVEDRSFTYVGAIEAQLVDPQICRSADGHGQPDEQPFVVSACRLQLTKTEVPLGEPRCGAFSYAAG
jgi:hypothetical protein